MILAIVISLVLLTMALTIFRAIKGPTTYDRILASNVFGTKTMIIIVLLSYLFEDSMYLDIALVYALINFVTTVALLKFFKYRSLGAE